MPKAMIGLRGITSWIRPAGFPHESLESETVKKPVPVSSLRTDRVLWYHTDRNPNLWAAKRTTKCT